MTLLDVLGLKNYRVFDQEKGFLEEFTSINLLTGANNTGKSSIVKALQMLKNSVEDPKNLKHPLSLDLKKQEHLLGDFDNLLFNKNDKSIEITLPFTFFGLTYFNVALLFESKNGKYDNYNAVLTEFKVVDKRDQQTLYSFKYREADILEKEDYEKKYNEEVSKFEEKRINNKSKEPQWLGALSTPHYNPLEAYIDWSIDLNKVRKELLFLKDLYTYYLEQKTMWIGKSLEDLDKRGADYSIVASLFINCFKEDITIADWSNFIKEGIKNVPYIKGQLHIGMNDFMSEDPLDSPPRIEDLLFYKAKEIIGDQLKWNSPNYSIIDNYFMNSWNDLLQSILAPK
ncbi:AAA family ATPase [Myroides odoratimimus]|uniref:AAA family ATPase n=1 Tax=Myroides odoratimimus TaxID=76832 RepID=UPI00257774D4|nr:AAA family ATPase [Myroides odoratimimus]MDM1085777.1 ATP-binding protein [Myroides odoratimimus]